MDMWTEIGQSGLRSGSGWLREERLPELRGRQGKAKYREMADRSAIIGACLGYTKRLIKGMEWDVRPANDSADAVAVAGLCRGALHDMAQPFAAFLDEALTCVEMGFALMEVVLKHRRGWSGDGSTRSKYDDGRVGLRKVALRAAESIERWDLDEHGGIRGAWQITEHGTVYIPIERLLLVRTTEAGNNPEGRSLLRNAYEPWYYAVKMTELEALGFERDAAGIPVMRIPEACFGPNAPPDLVAVRTTAEEIVKNIKQDRESGVLLPSAFHPTSNQQLYDLSLLSSAGSKQFDSGAIIARHEQRAAMALMADFVLLGHESVGSYALSGDKTTLFALATQQLADQITGPANAFLLPLLAEVNGYSRDLAPQLWHGPVQEEGLTLLGDFVSKLTSAGMPWYQALEDDLLSRASLPLRPDVVRESASPRPTRAPMRREMPPASKPKG